MSGAVSPERPYGELLTTTLCVLTWNVWGRFGPWREREAALIRTLRTLAPDVVALQEAIHLCYPGRKDPTLTEARSLGNRTPWNI